MANDLSFNIIAMDRASQALDRIADKYDKLAAKVDKLDGKDATVDVNIKSDKANAGIDLLDTRFKRMVTGIVAAAPLAGGAVIGGLGAAFIGVAALAVKSNAEVQASYKTLWADVVTETKAGANQIIPQIVAAGQMLDNEMRALGPQIKQAFAAAGPDVVALSQGVGDFAHNIMPGVTQAMQQSLPVFVGVETAAGRLGQTAGNAFASMSQHSQAYGRDVVSASAIVDGAMTGAVGLVNALGEVWARNADAIDSSVTNLGGSISGLATGAVPALSVGLGTIANAASVVFGVFDSIGPVLGTVGGLALVAWASFKGAALVATGVKALGVGVADMGMKMQSATAKSLVAGTAIEGFGRKAAVAGLGVSTVADKIAGPLSLVLVGGISLWSMFSSSTADSATSTEKMTQATDDLTSALAASHGAITQNVIDQLRGQDAFKAAADPLKQLGISQQQFIDAITKGGPALDALKARLNAIVEAGHSVIDQTDSGSYQDVFTPQAEAAQAALRNLLPLAAAYGNASGAQIDLTAATHSANVGLVESANVQNLAGTAAKALGVGLGDVNLGFVSVLDSGKAAADNLGDVVEQLFRWRDSISGAGASISDHFEQADRAVVQARGSVSDASHAVVAASRSIKDAQHSEAAAARAVVQAQQGVEEAERGVASAQEALAKAQQNERVAQEGLHVARQQAIQDLKDLREQVEDQAISKEQAKLRLFDAQQAAAGMGIATPQDAKKLQNATVTAENKDKIRAALELLSAEDAVSDAIDNGKNLRNQLTEAEKAGVTGSKVYKDAQQALRDAHKATADASYALTQAQRGLQRAQQQVSDAAYQQQRAHQAVRDAQYQQQQASQRLTEAQRQLKEAQNNASHSLDQNTEAGRKNLKMIYDLWDTIAATGLPAQEKYKTMIDLVASSFGISKEAARQYLVQLGRIPKDYHYGITAVADVDEISYQNLFKKAFIARDFGGMHADGGLITGPGGPRDDKIPAWLSNREFVVNAADTAKNLPLLEAINSGKVPQYRDGGLVMGMGLGLLGASYNVDVNARQVMGIKHPPQMPKYIPPAEVQFGSPGKVSGIPTSVAGNRATVLDVFSKMFGWSGGGMTNAIDFLLMHESGYRNTAQNPTSTAYGMFQFLDSTWRGYGIPKTSDPRQQSIAGGRYIKARYGDPFGAMRFWQGHHWYDEGGYLPEGAGAGVFTKGRGREMVLPPEMTKLTEDFARALYGGGRRSTVSAGGAVSTTVINNNRGGNTFVLNVYETDRAVDIEREFRRMMDQADQI